MGTLKRYMHTLPVIAVIFIFALAALTTPQTALAQESPTQQTRAAALSDIDPIVHYRYEIGNYVTGATTVAVEIPWMKRRDGEIVPFNNVAIQIASTTTTMDATGGGETSVTVKVANGISAASIEHVVPKLPIFLKLGEGEGTATSDHFKYYPIKAIDAYGTFYLNDIRGRSLMLATTGIEAVTTVIDLSFFP